VSTSFGGSVLGEAFYRIYRLILDSGGANPGGWRRFGAFVVSPVAGGNDLFFGDRYRGPALLPPSWMGELQAGMLIGGRVTDVNTGAAASETGPWASVGVHVNYGVPGTPDLRLRKPFDHFDLRAGLSFTSKAAQPAASLLVRGTVVGDTIESDERSLGLWGLFASYDVIDESVFKAAGFGLGPGVTLVGRWGWFELQGTALAEVLPWAGGGSINKLFDRDYHYGPGAEGLLDFRSLFGNRVIFDLSAREYFISGAYATGASEDVTWARAALITRIFGPHALSISADWATRRTRTCSSAASSSSRTTRSCRAGDRPPGRATPPLRPVTLRRPGFGLTASPAEARRRGNAPGAERRGARGAGSSASRQRACGTRRNQAPYPAACSRPRASGKIGCVTSCGTITRTSSPGGSRRCGVGPTRSLSRPPRCGTTSRICSRGSR